jgi:hypothetical protein
LAIASSSLIIIMSLFYENLNIIFRKKKVKKPKISHKKNNIEKLEQ